MKLLPALAALAALAGPAAAIESLTLELSRLDVSPVASLAAAPALSVRCADSLRAGRAVTAAVRDGRASLSWAGGAAAPVPQLLKCSVLAQGPGVVVERMLDTALLRSGTLERLYFSQDVSAVAEVTVDGGADVRALAGAEPLRAEIVEVTSRAVVGGSPASHVMVLYKGGKLGSTNPYLEVAEAPLRARSELSLGPVPADNEFQLRFEVTAHTPVNKVNREFLQLLRAPKAGETHDVSLSNGLVKLKLRFFRDTPEQAKLRAERESAKDGVKPTTTTGTATATAANAGLVDNNAAGAATSNTRARTTGTGTAGGVVGAGGAAGTTATLPANTGRF